MNKELVEKVKELVMEELHARQGGNVSQTMGIVRIWPHQHSIAKPIALTEEAVPHELLQGKVRFSHFPTS